MKYACVQKYYDDGNIKIKVRPALENEDFLHEINDDHDKWIEIFDSGEEATEYGNSKLK